MEQRGRPFGCVAASALLDSFLLCHFFFPPGALQPPQRRLILSVPLALVRKTCNRYPAIPISDDPRPCYKDVWMTAPIIIHRLCCQDLGAGETQYLPRYLPRAKRRFSLPQAVGPVTSVLFSEEIR